MNDQERKTTTPDDELLTAAMRGETSNLRAALAAGASPDARQSVTKAGWTALSCAVLSGREEAVQVLLAAGAEVNAQCPDGTTALHKACLWGHVRIAALLLAHGADATIEDQEGWTARQLAIVQDNQELLRLLAESAAPPAATNIDL
jgi:ankyrin repeat protein